MALAGRPTEHDYLQIAKDLEEWALKEDSIHFSQFAIEQGFSTRQLWNFSQLSDVLRDTMAKTKDHLNMKVREKLNDPEQDYHEKLALRDIYNYDALHREQCRDDKKFESKLTKDENAATVNLTQTAEMAESLEKALKKIEELEARLAKD